MLIRFLICLSQTVLLLQGLGLSQASVTRCLSFPEAADGRHILTVDLHTHSVFSDGHVWPTVRVWESERDCLDAMAVTEHLEYQPHWNDIPHPDRNRSFELASRQVARSSVPLLLIPGAEITRYYPPGHINAIFIQDANTLNFPQGERRRPGRDESRKALVAASRQGGFMFWNHSYWPRDHPNGIVEMNDFNRNLVNDGLLHGIEVANGDDYSEEAFQIALDYNLTVIGTSDIHGLVDWDYDVAGGGHRPATLVLATEPTLAGIEAALRQRASVAIYKSTLIGRDPEMQAILGGVLRLEVGEHRGDTTILNATLHNESPIDLLLQNIGEKHFYTSGDVIRVPARGSIRLQVKDVPDRAQLELTFEVLSAYTQPRVHPRITLR